MAKLKRNQTIEALEHVKAYCENFKDSCDGCVIRSWCEEQDGKMMPQEWTIEGKNEDEIINQKETESDFKIGDSQPNHH